MRRAARVDSSQDAIVSALRGCGISAEYIGKPFDLIIHNPRNKETAFMECKSLRPTSEGGSNGLTLEQLKWMAKWPGKIYVARTPEEAVWLVLGEKVMA